MADERVGEAFEGEVRLTVIGTPLRLGDPAPDFALEDLDPDTGGLRIVRLRDSSSLVRLLTIVNSLDTPVCHRETRRWHVLQSSLPPSVRLYTISMDLPYAQAQWRAAEG